MKALKYSIIGIVLFAAFLAYIINSENAVKLIANNMSEVKITRLENLSVKLWNISFKKLDFQYGNYELRASDADIRFNFSPFKLELDEVSIHALELLEHNTHVSTFKTELRPDALLETISPKQLQKLYSDYAHIKLSIQTLGIHTWRLQQGINFENLNMYASGSSLKLTTRSGNLDEGIAPDALHINSSINQHGEMLVSLMIDDNDFLKYHLSQNLTKQAQHPAYAWKSHLQINLSERFTDIAKFYFSDLESLVSQTSILELILEHNLDQTIFQDNVYRLTLSSDWKFRNRPHQVLPLNALSVALKGEGNFNYTNNVLENFKLQISPMSHLRLIPVANAKEFSQSDTLKFLSQKVFHITAHDGLTVNATNSRLTMNNGLSFQWAEKKDPAFIDASLSELSLHYDSILSPFESSKSLDFMHALNMRFNQHFSTRFTGTLSATQLHTQQKHINFKAHEQKLNSHIELLIEQDRNTLAGRYSLSSIDILTCKRHLSRLASFWDEDIELASGSIAVSGSFTHPYSQSFQKEQFTQQVQLSIQDIFLDYDGYLIRGLNFDSTLTGKAFQLESISPSTLTINELLAGALIKDFNINTHLNMNFIGDSEIYFEGLKAKIFEGKLSAHPFTLFIPHNSNENLPQPYHTSFSAKLESIQLTPILALAENPEIRGKGTLQGTLPIFLNEHYTLIKSGYVINTDSGFIQYKPDKTTRADLKKNPQMSLLVDVLGHLEYHTLKADLDLDDRGILLISGELKGLNPDYLSGYPIEFNPNIELDFRDMLKSMQIGETISNKIDKRAKAKNLD